MSDTAGSVGDKNCKAFEVSLDEFVKSDEYGRMTRKGHSLVDLGFAVGSMSWYQISGKYTSM